MFEKTEDPDEPIRFVYGERCQFGKGRYREYPERKEKEFWKESGCLESVKMYVEGLERYEI